MDLIISVISIFSNFKERANYVMKSRYPCHDFKDGQQIFHSLNRMLDTI